MERTTSAVKIWFWARNGGGAPAEVVNGSGSINTDTWGTSGAFFSGCGNRLMTTIAGTPIANYNNANCDINSKFRAANIIINLTLCGDWAGQPAIWAQSACANQGDWYARNSES